MSEIRLAFLGDIVGASGRKVVAERLPELKEKYKPDLVIANAENAAHGFGLTPSVAKEIFAMGIDVLTGGNHSWDKKEIVQVFQEYPQQVLRPANYPRVNPGKGSTIVYGKSGHKIGVVNVMGRVFMDALACPFETFKVELESLKRETKIIFVDFHGEASSEKYAFGYFADGEVSAIAGTHTHVQTADDQILPKGTGFLSDVGMNGPFESIIGMKKEIIIERFTRKLPIKMEVADGPGVFQAVIFTIDSDTGRCQNIERIRQLPRI